MDENYHLSMNGNQQGPFTLAQLRAGRAAGTISPDCYLWQEGMAEWQPVDEVLSSATPPALPGRSRLSGMIDARYEPEDGLPAVTETSGISYRDYSEVPWHRRSKTNTILILINILSFGFLPVVLLVCIFVLTGNVYYDAKDENGNLKTWSPGNKVAAVAILIINLFWLFA